MHPFNFAEQRRTQRTRKWLISHIKSLSRISCTCSNMKMTAVTTPFYLIPLKWDGVSLKTPRPRGWVGAGRPSGCKSSFNKRNMYQYPHVSQLFILLPWQSRVYPEPLKVVEFVQLTTECCWGQPSDPCQRGCLTSHACVMWGPRTLNADDDDDDEKIPRHFGSSPPTRHKTFNLMAFEFSQQNESTCTSWLCKYSYWNWLFAPDRLESGGTGARAQFHNGHYAWQCHKTIA